MANKKGLRAPRKVEIEIPIPSVKKYVGGSGPPMQKLYLVPPRDSTAYIIDRFILPLLKDTTPETRRLPYYYIGWTDEPVAKTLVPCNRALEYVSPAEIERWEDADYERRLQEKEQEAAGLATKPAGRGRPRKKRPEDTPPPSVAASDDALVLAKRLAGPSLSTPQKTRHQELFEEDAGGSSNVESDEAVQRQIRQEQGSASGDAGYADISDHDSVDQLPAARTISLVEDSSRASSTTPVPSDASLQPQPRSLFSVHARKTLKKPPALSAKPVETPIPPPPVVPTIHPAFLQSPLTRPSQTPSQPSSQKGEDIPPTKPKSAMKPKSTPQPVQKKATVQQTILSMTGFTPIASGKPHPRVSSQLSTPAASTPAGTSGSGMISGASTKRKRDTSAKKVVPGQPKGKKAKTNGKGKGKKRADSEEADTNDFLDPDVWAVKELLDDRYVYVEGVKIHEYLVNWEGNWPPGDNPTWESIENIRDKGLIVEYQRRKKAGLLKPDKSQRTLPSYMTMPQYSNVAEAFEGDIHDQENPASAGAESDSDEAKDEEFLVTDSKHSNRELSPGFRLFDEKPAQARRSFPG
ncbi:hypothetical protein B0T16DRAFT_400814 [Cercophora newfieldiana]|uniref:Chromo domain-containing protein n=1 Tax=Cercophora newfieldiana TaxID=92897 RepID=A0AA39YR06_9PEZI|nr:hypothetical protein B0T16DRAFT_400814 [Cercophora newfieldiana]